MTRPGIDVERMAERWIKNVTGSHAGRANPRRLPLQALVEAEIRTVLRAAARIADQKMRSGDTSDYSRGRSDAAAAIRHAARTRKGKSNV